MSSNRKLPNSKINRSRVDTEDAANRVAFRGQDLTIGKLSVHAPEVSDSSQKLQKAPESSDTAPKNQN